MSVFYDQASLVLVPSGYKSGVVYSQKPMTTDGQLTFTRASTATRVNASGVIETVSSGVPRLDYTNSTCPKLLLEPQRTNIALYSEQADNSYWLKYQSSITANQGVSPDGNTNADLLTASSSGIGVIYRNVGTAGAISCFMKANSLGSGNFYISVDGVGEATWNANGVKTNTPAAGTSYDGVSYGNGWYRFTYVVSTGTTINFGIAGATTGNSILLWGMQNEASASYPTSYIPTTSAAVTRLRDDLAKTGISSLIGQTSGTVFVEFEFSGSKDSFWPIMTVMGASSAELIEIYGSTGSDVVGAYMLDGGTTQFSRTTALTVGRHKLAIAYELNNTVAYLDGTVMGGVDTSCTIPTMTEIALGKFSYSSAYTFGDRINQALLFKTRLSNDQLAELTAL
jgi:hypothetical protein